MVTGLKGISGESHRVEGYFG